MSKKILVVGNGAREHAIVKAISHSKQDIYLTVIGNYINPGIATLASNSVVMAVTDLESVKTLAEKEAYDFAIIGPEASLEVGVVDALKALGIPCIGPNQKLAQIETSKQFCRELLSKYQPEAIPSFQYFDSQDGLKACISAYEGRCVIKADGLMGGKGVYVHGSHFDTEEEAESIALDLIQQNKSLLIEEKLEGVEFSLLSFCDGKTLKHMPLVQDNKRAYFDDKGPNTGGMGSISYCDHRLPYLSTTHIEQAQKINEKAIEGLQEETGETYCGIIYGGYMATASGIKLIEFNARFGDPEAINLLALLETDFVDICTHMLEGRLSEIDVSFHEKFSVCKYVVPQGYPLEPIKNEPVDFDVNDEDLYVASVGEQDNAYHLLGSRAVACLGVAESLSEAEALADEKARSVKGPVFYRKDIGTESLCQKRQDEAMRVLGDAH